MNAMKGQYNNYINDLSQHFVSLEILIWPCTRIVAAIACAEHYHHKILLKYIILLRV